MGLHQKARNLLFKDFIIRNYQGTERTKQKLLLNSKPDDILENNIKIQLYQKTNKAFVELLESCLVLNQAKGLDNVFEAITSQLNSRRILFYLHNPEKQAFSIKFFKGLKDKEKEKWQINQSQYNFLIPKIKKSKNLKLKIDRTELDENFDEIDDNVFFYVVRNEKKICGIFITGEVSTLVDDEFNEIQLNMYFKLFSLLLDGVGDQLIIKSYKKESSESSKLIYQIIDELSESDGFNSNSILSLSRKLKLKKYVLMKMEKNKLRTIGAVGINGYKPVDIPMVSGLKKDGFADNQLNIYLKEQVSPWGNEMKSIYLYKMKRDEGYTFMFFDLPKSFSGENTLPVITKVFMSMMIVSKIKNNLFLDNTGP